MASEQRELALALYGDFVEKLLWGGKVAGLRVTLRHADPVVIRALVRQAWEHKAPASLVQSLANSTG